jgi:hypothetical protein
MERLVATYSLIINATVVVERGKKKKNDSANN